MAHSFFNGNKIKFQNLSINKHVLAPDMKKFISLCETKVNFLSSDFPKPRNENFNDLFENFIYDIESLLKSITYRAKIINRYEELRTLEEQNKFRFNLIEQINIDIYKVVKMDNYEK